jgi:uncharacterized protein (TIGR02996 family)
MTSDGEALFRAVCENPAEDTPRLVYADWLEENGRPERAEFIRLQCEAWNLCPDYPDETARRVRASELLRLFGDRWYGELPDLPRVNWGALFVRGFIDMATVGVVGDLGGTLGSLFAAAPLQYLIVLSLNPGQLRQLFACPTLSRLKRLQLPGIRGQEEARLLTEGRQRFPNVEID